MKIKTSELTGAALDWAVAKCEGGIWEDGSMPCWPMWPDSGYCKPSTDWAQGGPILERKRIHIRPNQSDGDFKAFVIIPPTGLAHRHDGPTALIAAMRCCVASELGDEVEIPEELI